MIKPTECGMKIKTNNMLSPTGSETSMKLLQVLACLAVLVVGVEFLHAGDEVRVILHRESIAGDSHSAKDAHDVYGISQETFDAQQTLDLSKDAIPLSSEDAIRTCFAHFTKFYAKPQTNIKDKFIVWRVELRHMPETRRGVYQGKFYYFVEMQLFRENGKPFFSRRGVLLDRTVVAPVREYTEQAKSQPQRTRTSRAAESRVLQQRNE
jgi:hypothetical protein